MIIKAIVNIEFNVMLKLLNKFKKKAITKLKFESKFDS